VPSAAASPLSAIEDALALSEGTEV